MQSFDYPPIDEPAHYRRLKSNPLIKLRVRNGEATCIAAGRRVCNWHAQSLIVALRQPFSPRDLRCGK
jgi:hypothetical protein